MLYCTSWLYRCGSGRRGSSSGIQQQQCLVVVDAGCDAVMDGPHELFGVLMCGRVEYEQLSTINEVSRIIVVLLAGRGQYSYATPNGESLT